MKDYCYTLIAATSLVLAAEFILVIFMACVYYIIKWIKK